MIALIMGIRDCLTRSKILTFYVVYDTLKDDTKSQPRTQARSLSLLLPCRRKRDPDWTWSRDHPKSGAQKNWIAERGDKVKKLLLWQFYSLREGR